ncbi:MAG: S26 family signal peptidase [Oscillospiraceae bacterium]|nr:S26 family signal peptidase [Oscillospiraceae bacterium]
MIYRNSYFRKEMRQAYTENQISKKRKVGAALFAGLLSFAIHFVLQTLTESVLSDTIPFVMQASYFSTLYTYISVAFLLYVIYFIIYYDDLSFAEIQKNRWYLLVKMGYQPMKMIYLKLIASFFSLFLYYSSGFIFILCLTYFLKYSFIYAYIPTLYIVGLVDLIVFEAMAMAGSLFIRKAANTKYFLVFTAVFIGIIRVATGYYDLVSNRILMQNFFSLFQFHRSTYLPVAFVLVVLCLAICFLRARSIARYYSMPFETYGYVMPENATVVRLDQRTGKISLLNSVDRAKFRKKVFDAATTIFLIIFICSALAFNIFIILLSSAQPGKEVTIRGTIPYVFKSNTMEPAIMENDLAYFKRMDAQEAIHPGEIVLFQKDKVVYVERVKSIAGGKYTVDIDYYPPLSQKGAMMKTVERTAIYGVFTGRNRWLGALILFANTIIGRMAFLMIPAFLLFFYKPLRAFFEKNAKGYLEE